MSQSCATTLSWNRRKRFFGRSKRGSKCTPIDTDIFIDYLKGIQPACALLDSPQFDIYYFSWTRKELLAKRGLRESERQEIVVLLGPFRMIPVDDAVAEK